MSRDDKDTMTALLGCFGAIMLLPAVVALATAINGFILQTLWGWFVVPQFGAAALSLPVASGLALVVGCVQHHPREWEKEGETTLDKWLRIGGNLVLRPVFYLLIGYVLHRIAA